MFQDNWSKQILIQYILVKKIGQQKFWVQTNFCSKNSRWKFRTLSLKFLNPKRFLEKKILDQKVLSPKDLGQKKLVQKNSVKKSFGKQESKHYKGN